jgi:hypothetical protein
MKIRSGKYKGKKIEWVVNNDLHYAQNMTTDISSSTEIKRAVQLCINNKNSR